MARLEYKERGSGPAMVLVHGFPLDRRIWNFQREVLSAKFRVITPDLKGFGNSRPIGPFSIESQADAVFELIDEIKATPCILGGLSMGGYVAMAFARKYPGVLHGLVLVDTKAEADTPEGIAGRNRMLAKLKAQGSRAVTDEMLPNMAWSGTRPGIVGRLRMFMESCHAKTLAYAIPALRDRPDFRESLASIRVPTLIIVGEKDVIAPVSCSQDMHRRIAGSTLAVIPNSGHMAPIEQPHLVNAAIRDFARQFLRPEDRPPLPKPPESEPILDDAIADED